MRMNAARYNELCPVDTALVSLIGDGHCDAVGGYNTYGCGWDGGDCCE